MAKRSIQIFSEHSWLTQAADQKQWNGQPE